MRVSCLGVFRPVVSSAVPISLALAILTQIAQAQGDDVANLAIASREKLIADISAVDGSLLREKLVKESDHEQLGHWYRGQVKINGQWLKLPEVEQLAADDELMSEYRELRSRISDHLADHQKLARWCAKNKLKDQANMHWLHVLRFDRGNRPALKELGLTWYAGRLVTHEEAERFREHDREELKEKKKWRPVMKRLRNDVEQDDPVVQKAAKQELLEIHEPKAVPALIDEFAEPAKTEQQSVRRASHLVSTLGGIECPQSIDILAQIAVEASDSSIRYAAIEQLKSKPLESCVPSLLAGMALPVEAAVDIREVGNRIVSSYSYAQEGPGGKVYQKNTKAYRVVPGAKYLSIPMYRVRHHPRQKIRDAYTMPGRIEPGHYSSCGGYWVPERYIPPKRVPAQYREARTETTYVRDFQSDNPTYAAKRDRVQQMARSQAARQAQELVERNIAIERQNERIAAVLTEITGATLTAYPKSWWNWWSDYLDRHPGAANAGTRQQLNALLLNQRRRGLARGTWIWTRQGKRPVETVLPGDFVLSQNLNTGELAYKVVISLESPRMQKTLRIQSEDTEFFCTPGHVVFTVGSGWQRASKLAAGRSLHGVMSSARVENVAEAFEIESYDLVVDGFHTLFVGQQGLLVHDATPIGPTHVALPGFSPAAVADAAKLAAN